MSLADPSTELAGRTCAHCGTHVVTTFCPACGADPFGRRLPLCAPSPAAQSALHRLNWGAALLPGFWTYAHGAPVLGTMFWLAFLPMPPVSIGIMVYLLFNGNRVALERRRFADPATFTRVERSWTVAGILSFPLFAAAFVLYAFLALINLRLLAGTK